MKERNYEATNYLNMKRIYRENYLEDVSHRLRKEAEEEKENCS